MEMDGLGVLKGVGGLGCGSDGNFLAEILVASPEIDMVNLCFWVLLNWTNCL